MPTTSRSLTGDLLIGKAWWRGRIDFNDKIQEIDAQPLTGPPLTGPMAGPYIVPGFIDLHVPGGGGGDALEGAEGVRKLARLHARHGTTSLTPALVTAPAADLLAAGRGIDTVQRNPAPGESDIIGAHIEGPFLNPAALGAQPPHAAAPDLELMKALMEVVNIKIVTLAPELDGAHELIRALTKAGIRVQIGHSLASFDQVKAALDAGAAGFTHLYNAMSGLHHRAPGVLGAALAHGHYAAIIPDLLHVHAGAIQAALRAIPGLFFVTDSVAATGMPDGPYTLGRSAIIKRGNAVFLDDQTAKPADPVIAGSALTMDRALLNLLAIGLAPEEALFRLSAIPAEYLNLTDRGRLCIGRRADILVLRADMTLDEIFIQGIRI